MLRKLLGEKLDIERRIAEEKKAHIARRKLAKGSKAKPKGVKASIPRKHSLKASPGVNGNGHAKKPRKSKEMAYKDEDDEMDSEEEGQAMTLTQKQELAEKIQVAESDVLSKAIQIIQQSTKLGAVSGLQLICNLLIWDTRIMRRSSWISTHCHLVQSTGYTTSYAAAVASLGDRRARLRWVRGRRWVVRGQAELRGST